MIAARALLIKEGIASVEIGQLARKLRVTRGGFYWFFASRNQLLDELLADWETNNTAAFRAVLNNVYSKGFAEYRAIVDIWVNEENYSSQWDAAVRDWARSSVKVAAAVRRIDDERIEILKRTFLDMGVEDLEAFVRARTTYFHQVGYYSLGVRESHAERLRLMPIYLRILTDRTD